MAFSPSTSLVTLRPDLAQSFESWDYEAQQKGFIATKVLPVSQVGNQLGNYGKIPLEQLIQKRDTSRAPGAAYNTANTTFTSGVYNCKENGWVEYIDDREVNAYKNYFDAEVLAARRARDTVLRNMENRVVTLLNDTASTFSSYTGAVGTTWNTVATADPVTDIKTASIAIRNNSGVTPDTVVFSYKQMWNLKRNASIQSQVKYSGFDDPKFVGEAFLNMLAGLFDVRQVLVAGALYNSANAGQTASLASMWSDDKVLVCKAAESEDFREVCLGRVFHWAGDGSSENGTVESYRVEDRRSNAIRVRQDTDEQIIYAPCGYVLTGANG